MLSIALTGGIGSGKTTVTELFSQLGIPVIDADTISRELLSGSIHYRPNQALLQVKDLFGTHFFNSDGRLKRAELRQAVFSSINNKQQLEAILHPLVYQEIYHLIDKIKIQSPPYIIISIPLLLETKQQHRFDKVLVIDSNAEQQLARALRRDNSKVEVIQAIIDSQVNRETRLKAADYILNNSGSIDGLQNQVAHIHQLLLKEIKT
jgi:dephospho-CoA kinase